MKHSLYTMATNNSQTNKRFRLGNDLSTMITASASEVCSWPRFLVVKGSDPSNSLSKLSPFALNKAMVGILGTEPCNMKKLRDGNILVEVEKEYHSKVLLKIEKLCLTMDISIPVSVTPHNGLNWKKGVIRCHDIKECSDDEILQGLEKEGVVKVDRIRVMREGQRISTGTFILTFQRQALPTTIRVGYVRVAVSQYIPNPIRCFKCQLFGHTKLNCKRKEVCPRCGSDDHIDSNECTKEAKCINCEGKHAANDKICPKWKEEKEIQKIKTERGVSYTEAKKFVTIFNGGRSVTYAQVSSMKKTECKSVEVQTLMTWPNNLDKPKVIEKPKSNAVAATSSGTQTTANVSQSQTTKSGSHTASNVKSSDPKGQLKLVINKNKNKIVSNREIKGSKDIVQQFNKFGCLSEDDEYGSLSDEDDGKMHVDQSPVTQNQGHNSGTSRNGRS